MEGCPLRLTPVMAVGWVDFLLPHIPTSLFFFRSRTGIKFEDAFAMMTKCIAAAIKGGMPVVLDVKDASPHWYGGGGAHMGERRDACGAGCEGCLPTLVQPDAPHGMGGGGEGSKSAGLQ